MNIQYRHRTCLCFPIRDGCSMSFHGWWQFPPLFSADVSLTTSSVKVNQWLHVKSAICHFSTAAIYSLSELLGFSRIKLAHIATTQTTRSCLWEDIHSSGYCDSHYKHMHMLICTYNKNFIRCLFCLPTKQVTIQPL